MDYQHLLQWRKQHQPDHQQPSAKIPRLLLDHHQQQQKPGKQHQSSVSDLTLFVGQPNSKNGNMSAFNDPMSSTRAPSVFSLAQWQELELQALVFKYIFAGASVPLDLIQLIKKSLLNGSAFSHHHHELYQHQQYQHFQSAMLSTGYWGRSALDMEPGRCRRTDGKKWRCSRDVMGGEKYCERHVHRGRNRSRKHVEIPTPVATSVLKGPVAASPLAADDKQTHLAISGSSPSIDLLHHLNQRSSESKTENVCLTQDHHHRNISSEESGGVKSEGQTLRHFFTDWPRSQQELKSTGQKASLGTSTTHLSISIPGNSLSDISLQLSTGNGDKLDSNSSNARDWRVQEAFFGGPLAEALRSSTSSSTPSPTSILHRPCGSTSETSSIST